MNLPDDDPEPVPPERPYPGECCGHGCEPCVFDLYDEALERYQRELRAWRERKDKRAGRSGRAAGASCATYTARAGPN